MLAYWVVLVAGAEWSAAGSFWRAKVFGWHIGGALGMCPGNAGMQRGCVSGHCGLLLRRRDEGELADSAGSGAVGVGHCGADLDGLAYGEWAYCVAAWVIGCAVVEAHVRIHHHPFQRGCLAGDHGVTA